MWQGQRVILLNRCICRVSNVVLEDNKCFLRKAVNDCSRTILTKIIFEVFDAQLMSRRSLSTAKVLIMKICTQT